MQDLLNFKTKRTKSLFLVPLFFSISSIAVAERPTSTERKTTTAERSNERSGYNKSGAIPRDAAAVSNEDKASSQIRTEETISSFSNTNRTNDRFGAYISAWGDPYPATLGVNLAYNVYDFARINVGVGMEDENNYKLSTVGAGVKAFVPGWTLSPTVGANISVTDSGAEGRRSIRGFDPAGTRAYATAGLDWQSGVGINLAAGYAQSLRSGEDGNIFFNAGFFL